MALEIVWLMNLNLVANNYDWKFNQFELILNYFLWLGKQYVIETSKLIAYVLGLAAYLTLGCYKSCFDRVS